MRKICMMFALSLSLVFAACGDDNDDDIIVDYAPVEFYISVETSKGVDLLNAENEGALDLDAIELWYDGNIYVLNPKTDAQSTRAYFVRFEGMKLQQVDGKYRIYVGEFDGAPGTGVKSGDFTMNWGDGSSDTFSYTNHKVGKYDVEHKFFHNGKSVKSENTPYISIKVIK